MYVDESTATLSLVRDNRTYYFCNSACRDDFSAPEAGLARLRHRLLVAWPLAIFVVALTYVWHPRDWAWVSLAAATVVQLYAGGAFYRGAWEAIRARAGNMDLLIATGTSAAYAYSVAALLLPGQLPPAYYFDASSLIIALILTGNYLEHLTRHRASGALRRLRDELPSTATVVRNGQELTLPTAQVRTGDMVRVRPGERLPVDGEVRRGRSTVVEALVTGESLPQVRTTGSRVIAGTINGDGLLDIEATGVGVDSTVEKLGALLTDAELSRISLQRTADRIASAFVPSVLVLAVVAAAVWGVVTHFSNAPLVVLVFVSVVITACPCAFGLATPAALLVGTGRAAEEGIWIKDRDAIEEGSRVTMVLTDKTGTLTEGRPRLTEVWVPSDNDLNDPLRLAAGVEEGSEHPLAQAVVAFAKARNLVLLASQHVRSIPGVGVEGIVDGRHVSIGWSQEETVDEGPEWRSALLRFRSSPRTVSVVRVDDRPVALLAFEDAVSPGSPEGVADLVARGISVAMVTGDRPEVAHRVAQQVGISRVFANVGPAQKLEILRRFQAEGQSVAFVGDGLNDAPVLAGAEPGIAVGTATDVAREAGGMVLARRDFRQVDLALRLCRRTVRRVRENLGWAIGYNLILLPIAAGAVVPLFGYRVYEVLPILGAAAMGLSSTFVLLNSLSLRWVSLRAPPERTVAAPGLPS
jgi:P-type Cu+ transporter